MISKNFDTRSKNIDTFIDMINNAQRDNGITPTMQEALYDPITKRKINIFERVRLEKEGVDLSKYGNSSNCGNCRNCQKDEKNISNIQRGVFVYNTDDLIDESDDELYVCEFCTKIGYSSSYKPDVCDTCDDCEGCTEYISGECDGCGYSTLYNGGCSYGEVGGDNNYEMNPEDSQLFDEINNGGPDYEVKKPDGGFSIMNY